MSLDSLPLLALHKPHTPDLIAELQSALRRYGAFRLAAPQNTQERLSEVLTKAREFFDQPSDVKTKTKGYSPFASESIRGRTAIPKESIYFFCDDTEPEKMQPEFHHIVKALHEEWTPIRLQLLDTVSQVLNSSTPLTGSPLLDSATMGIHYYDSETLHSSPDFSPAHVDSGTLTILFRSYTDNDGLEIADLHSTQKRDSAGIGADASFAPVPTARNEAPEVIVFAGNTIQRLVGSDRVRACVHRVRGPGKGGDKRRLSIVLFCAPSALSTQRSLSRASN
ncbi:hypothetical protein BJX61DRAFT_492556 [Aspergillus egyptiacus]|nr:hypothetical protein BJX61DRAFT_492556 [Aspergillus egyptiacus]